MKTIIEFNATMAMFEGDKIIAWCAMLDTGEVGHVVVREEYRRNRFASNILLRLVQILHEKGRIPYGYADFWNKKAFDAYIQLGGDWVDIRSHIGLKKIAFTDKPHQNWYQL